MRLSFLSLLVVGFAISASAAEVKFSGDARWRILNATTNTGAAGANDLTDSNQQNRFRLMATALVDDQFSAVARISTAGNVFNAAAVTADGSGRRTAFYDLLHIIYKPMADLSLTFGKVGNTIAWQAGYGNWINFGLDNTWDGYTVAWKKPFGAFTPFVNLGYYQLVAGGSNGVDAYLNIAQAGVRWEQETMRAALAYGMYSTTSLVGKAPTLVTPAATQSTFDDTGTFQKEYKVSDIQAEFGMTTGIPWAVFAGMTSNSEASSEGQATIFGVNLGKTKGAGNWFVAFDVRDVKRDSTMIFQGEPFAQGLEHKGSRLFLNYMLTDNLQSSIYYQQFKTGSVTNGVEAKLDRYHLSFDLTF